jgi:hypothetical protein
LRQVEQDKKNVQSFEFSARVRENHMLAFRAVVAIVLTASLSFLPVAACLGLQIWRMVQLRGKRRSRSAVLRRWVGLSVVGFSFLGSCNVLWVYALNAHHVRSRDWCNIALHSCSLVYFLACWVMYLYLFLKQRLVRRRGAFSILEKLILVAMMGVPAFAVFVNTLFSGSWGYDGQCEEQIPVPLTVATLCMDSVLSGALLLLFLHPLRRHIRVAYAEQRATNTRKLRLSLVQNAVVCLSTIIGGATALMWLAVTSLLQSPLRFFAFAIISCSMSVNCAGMLYLERSTALTSRPCCQCFRKRKLFADAHTIVVVSAAIDNTNIPPWSSQDVQLHI